MRTLERDPPVLVCATDTPASIVRCVRLGVRSIEHGNQLDDASAAAMARAGAFLSQTIVTYVALRESGRANGMPEELIAKVGALVEEGMASISIAKRNGVSITYGSDLLASMRERQLEGFGVLLDAGLSPAEALATATSTAAELVGLAAGTIAVGRLCDLVMLKRNPLAATTLRTLSEADVARVWIGGKEVISR
jgi:imidazolonepropionase-like amidohydrolase